MIDIYTLIFTVLLLPLLSYGISAGVNGWVIRRAHDKKIMAKVNKRSNHASPTPQGGGLGVMAGFSAALVFFLFYAAPILQLNGMMDISQALGLVVMGLGLLVILAALTLVSWRNDEKSIAAHWRLGLHFVCAALIILAQPLSGLGILLGLVLTVLWVWYINLYNFMDGIDEILVVETLSIVLGLALIAAALGAWQQAVLLPIYLIAALLGFWKFNRHPAKLFAGDAGSIPLGYITGGALILLALKLDWVPALILPLYFVMDASVTLALRLHARKKIWEAHSEHFYQQATRRWKNHRKVVVRIAGLNALLVLLAVLCVVWPVLRYPALVVALALTSGLMWHFKKA